jgi:hypothetical protein
MEMNPEQQLKSTKRIILGGGGYEATPIFLKPGKNLLIDGNSITSFTIKGGDIGETTGIESARLMVRQPGRRQGDPEFVLRPLPTDPGGEVDWSSVYAVRITTVDKDSVNNPVMNPDGSTKKTATDYVNDDFFTLEKPLPPPLQVIPEQLIQVNPQEQPVTPLVQETPAITSSESLTPETPLVDIQQLTDNPIQVEPARSTLEAITQGDSVIQSENPENSESPLDETEVNTKTQENPIINPQSATKQVVQENVDAIQNIDNSPDITPMPDEILNPDQKTENTNEIPSQEKQEDNVQKTDEITHTDVIQSSVEVPSDENIDDKLVVSFVKLDGIEGRVRDLTQKNLIQPLTPREHEEYTGLQGLWEKVKDKLYMLREVKRRVWKSLLRPYFEEKLNQYHRKAIEVSELPYIDKSLTEAENRAKEKYEAELKAKGPLGGAARKFVDYMKDNTYGLTRLQELTLNELEEMKLSGEIAIFEEEKSVFDAAAAETRHRMELSFDTEDQVIRKELGEKLTILTPDNPQYQSITNGIKDLMKKRLNGELTGKEWEQARDTFFHEQVASLDPSTYAEAKLYASSLDEIATTLEVRRDHDAGLFDLDKTMDQMEIRLGVAMMGETTALEPTATSKGVDIVKKTLDYFQKNGILTSALVSDATIGTGVSFAIALASVPVTLSSGVARRFGTTIAGAWVGGIAGAAVAGTVGGVKEYINIKQDYMTHMRQREAGGTIEPGSHRREWMEKYYINQRDATELSDSLTTSFLTETGQVKDTLTNEELHMILGNLADAKARKVVSSRGIRRIGLIKYSSVAGIEAERTALDKAIIDTERKLTEYSENSSHAKQMKKVIGDMKFNEFSSFLTQAQINVLSQGQSFVNPALDRAEAIESILGNVSEFNPETTIISERMKAHKAEYPGGMEEILHDMHKAAKKEAIKYGIKRGVSGLIIGALIQEGISDISHYAQTGQFAFTGMLAPNNLAHLPSELQYELQKAGHAITEAIPIGPNIAEPIIPTWMEHQIGDPTLLDPATKAHIQMPENFKLDSQGNIEVVVPGSNTPVDVLNHNDIQLNIDGSLSSHSLGLLKEHVNALYPGQAIISAETLHAATHTIPLPPDDHLNLVVNGHKVLAPQELHWEVTASAGGVAGVPQTHARLILDGFDADGHPADIVIKDNIDWVGSATSGHPVNQTEIEQILHNHPMLGWHDGAAGVNSTIVHAPTEHFNVANVKLPDGSFYKTGIDFPKGTILDYDRAKGVFNLIDNEGVDKGKVLLSGIKIDFHDGHIINLADVQKDGLAHGITVGQYHDLAKYIDPGTPGGPGGGGGPTIETIPWKVEEFKQYEGGMTDKIWAAVKSQGLAHGNPIVNAEKNIIRTMIEHKMPFVTIHEGGKDLTLSQLPMTPGAPGTPWYGALGNRPDVTFDLPKVLYTDDGMRSFAKLTNKAIEYVNTQSGGSFGKAEAVIKAMRQAGVTDIAAGGKGEQLAMAIVAEAGRGNPDMSEADVRFLLTHLSGGPITPPVPPVPPHQDTLAFFKGIISWKEQVPSTTAPFVSIATDAPITNTIITLTNPNQIPAPIIPLNIAASPLLESITPGVTLKTPIPPTPLVDSDISQIPPIIPEDEYIEKNEDKKDKKKDTTEQPRTSGEDVPENISAIANLIAEEQRKTRTELADSLDKAVQPQNPKNDGDTVVVEKTPIEQPEEPKQSPNPSDPDYITMIHDDKSVEPLNTQTNNIQKDQPVL